MQSGEARNGQQQKSIHLEWDGHVQTAPEGFQPATFLTTLTVITQNTTDDSPTR